MKILHHNFHFVKYIFFLADLVLFDQDCYIMEWIRKQL